MSRMDAVDRYSRLVLWLKIALPLVALAILSTLFFVAETLDPEAAIPYAEVDVERILREQGVTNPTFGGVSDSGVAISFSAQALRPVGGENDRLSGQSLTAVLDFPSGAHVDMTSPAGMIDARTQTAVLEGGARLESSNGYSVETDRLTAFVQDGRVVSDGEVTANGPAGELKAGRMELTLAPGQSDGHVLNFTGGVRLIYRPGS